MGPSTQKGQRTPYAGMRSNTNPPELLKETLFIRKAVKTRIKRSNRQAITSARSGEEADQLVASSNSLVRKTMGFTLSNPTILTRPSRMRTLHKPSA